MKLLENRKTNTNSSLAKYTQIQEHRKTNDFLYTCKNKYDRLNNVQPPTEDIHTLVPEIRDHVTLYGRRTLQMWLNGKIIQMGPM